MSPISAVLHELRNAFGLRQVELANLLGYEQSYISALEIGTKGPPPPEFVNRLIGKLNLDPDWQTQLWDSLEYSQRKIVLPPEAPEAIYRLLNEFRQKFERLHPDQIELIRIALKLPQSLAVECPRPLRRRIRRRGNNHSITEAEM